MGKDTCIISVPLCDIVKIYCLTFIFGAWVICTMLLKYVWNPNTFSSIGRDNPPSCLVDSSLGQHKYVKLKGVKLHYVESGMKNQPLILLLHGFPDCWLSWRHQISFLSQYFRVVALDLKGFGDSDKPTNRNNYRLEIILEELKQLISTLGVSNCIVIGHDIGGLLGWYLAQQDPKIVNKLIIVSSPHPNIYIKTLHTSVRYRWLHFLQLPCLPEIDALKEDVNIINDFHKHLSPKDMYLEAYKYTFSRKEDWTGPINYYRNIIFTEITEKLDLIRIPVLLITGSKDTFTKLENVVKSTEYCEKSHVKIIDGCKHFPHQENSNMFNAAVLHFLGRKKLSDSFLEKPSSKGIMDRMLGAVSNTVKYGNSVLDTVQKKTNGVVGGIPTIGLLNYNSNCVKSDKG